MIEVHFITHSGDHYTVAAQSGETLMQVAVRNDVPGIEAECGGACACATCHVYVDESWAAKLPQARPMEEDMLDFAYDIRANSRLSCQIRLDESLNGLTVHVPERQA